LLVVDLLSLRRRQLAAVPRAIGLHFLASLVL